jgi:hypothetical protein
VPPNWGLHVTAPLQPEGGSALSFVSVRLTTFPQGVSTLPPGVQVRLEEVLAVQVGGRRQRGGLALAACASSCEGSAGFRSSPRCD